MTDPPDGGQPAEERPARQKGERFREGDDAQQLEEIEEAQQKARQGKSDKRIDSIEKSRQRLKNRLRQIRRLDDLDPRPKEGEG